MTIDRPKRKHPTHGIIFIDGQSTIIFDTVCTKNRKQLLACDDVHATLGKVWQHATAWLMGRYVIMPDHIHFFAMATDSGIEYENWVTYWKSQFTKQYGNSGNNWQTDHWDTRIRSAQQYDEKWEYVRNNPVRHGLVAKADDWPFQGEIHILRWH